MATITTTVQDITDSLRDKLSLNQSKPATRPPGQPDIDYHPDEANWKARTARRLAEDPQLPQTSLPDGFPLKLQSPLVWEGKDWKDENEWVYNLKAEELTEIDDALKHFKCGLSY
jgi:hypothetical protein